MFTILKSRPFIATLGFVLLGCFIWFAGPYFSFADYRPLESGGARLAAMALVLVAAAIVVLLKRVRARRASDKLIADVMQQSEKEERPGADVLQLRERFEEGIAALRHKRHGGRSLYELPWYVIIGAPGSGKTTALLNSGLHFPIEQRAGHGLRGVGGTRNCEWLFADEAVFLDTAGRYTTQDSDPAGDGAAWSEFLALLRKHRKRRPLNGVILTISAEDLMVAGEASRAAHVASARRRLNELNRELRIQLPVYLMVTKCDLIAGFAEHFDDLTHEGRRQVWGVTFPYDQTQKGTAARAFGGELDALVQRLNERLLGRLEEDHDVRRRTRIFGFPQQMAVLRTALADFVADVFSSTMFDRPVLLRGVYFTSGTQAGTPIDRLIGAIGRRFALAADAIPAPAGPAKVYFIERFLTDVLLAESGLAGLNRRVEVQKAAAQLGAYAATILAALTCVILLSISYSRNRSYLDRVAGNVASLDHVQSADTSLDTLLPRLSAVRTVVDSANVYEDGSPWSMRMGLYQGTSVGNAARDAYVRELDNALLPHVASRIKNRLIEYGPEPEKLYEYLKAYLMLGHPEHLDTAQLGFITDLEWQSVAATEGADIATALAKHFNALLKYQDSLRAIPLDDSLVAQARSTIRQASIAALIYRQIRLGYAGDSKRALRLDLAAGVGAQRVLRLKSGTPLSQPVPAIYTPAVFKEVTGRGADDIVNQFAADHWVWGDAGAPSVSSSRLSADVIEAYEKDYIATWDRIVKDIEPVPLTSLSNTKEALAILSGPTSPLRGLLKTVDEHTFLVQTPEAKEQDKGIRARLGDIFKKGKEAVGLATAVPGTQITAYFAPIHQLVNGQSGPAPLDGVLEKFKQIQQKLEPVGGGVGQTDPLDPATVNSIGEVVSSLRRDTAALPPSIAAVVMSVANSAASVTRAGVRGTLANRYAQEVLGPCTTITAGRYPFVSGSTADVPLADFGRLFGYDGVFDSFFKKELQPLVDTSRSPWVWRADASGASVGPSAVVLRQFEAAQAIRETFFRQGSQEPEVKFGITPTDLDATATRFVLELDGQRFEYRHGPERTAQATWPGPMPGQAAASFEDRTSARPHQVFDGPWAWFRLVDAADLERETDIRYGLRFQIGGHDARVTVDAVSLRNPYANRDLQRFRCESAS